MAPDRFRYRTRWFQMASKSTSCKMAQDGLKDCAIWLQMTSKIAQDSSGRPPSQHSERMKSNIAQDGSTWPLRSQEMGPDGIYPDIAQYGLQDGAGWLQGGIQVNIAQHDLQGSARWPRTASSLTLRKDDIQDSARWLHTVSKVATDGSRCIEDSGR